MLREGAVYRSDRMSAGLWSAETQPFPPEVGQQNVATTRALREPGASAPRLRGPYNGRQRIGRINVLTRPKMRTSLSVVGEIVLTILAISSLCHAQNTSNQAPELKVFACEDFEVSGDGRNAAWQKTAWVPMQVRPQSAHDYQSRFKILYSKKGLYVLFDGADKRITASKTEDYLDLWTEDVYECFFWTDERHPIYFEYEISPLGFELPILIPISTASFLVGDRGTLANRLKIV